MIKKIIRLTCDNSPVRCFEEIEFEGHCMSLKEIIKKSGWTIKANGGNHLCYCPKCSPIGRRLQYYKKKKKIKMVKK